MSIPTYEMKALNCRILVPMTMPEKEAEENVRFFEKHPHNYLSPIETCRVVDVTPLSLEYNNEIQYGIQIVVINLNKVLKMLGKTDKDLFYLKFIDENEEESNYCEITKSKIPFHFYYDGENLNILG